MFKGSEEDVCFIFAGGSSVSQSYSSVRAHGIRVLKARLMTRRFQLHMWLKKSQGDALQLC
jgi:hypothetical protein